MSGGPPWFVHPNVCNLSAKYVNGVRTADVHGLTVSVDREAGAVTIGRRGEDDRTEFDLDDRADLDAWFSTYFGLDVTVVRDETGMSDRPDRGPTVISTGTLREVASWFDGVSTESVRRRFRANVEIGGVPAFWEDRLYAAEGPRSFKIGAVRFEGEGPCTRCVVPTRNPDTGERTGAFQETFVEQREATFPEWTPAERFDHYYKLMTNTRVPESEWGETISVGDTVRMLSD